MDKVDFEHFDDDSRMNIEASRVAPPQRSKSSLRIKYDAETSLIRRKIGGLEEIRGKLGISQRRICQLLMVDPSAWTRWTRDDESAPPHIYRMLQWYLAVEEKYPALDVGFWVSTVTRGTRDLEFEQKSRENDRNLKSLENEISSLKNELRNYESRLDFAAQASRNREKYLWLALTICGFGLAMFFAVFVSKF